MRQIDKYYNFLISAISSPVKNASFNYFYDNENHILIKINSNVIDINKRLIQLSKLNTETKKKFLINFAMKENDEIKKYLLNKIDEFNDESEMNLQQTLKKFGTVAAKLDLLSGEFLIKSAEKEYKKFNLSEDMDVEFHCK